MAILSVCLTIRTETENVLRSEGHVQIEQTREADDGGDISDDEIANEQEQPDSHRRPTVFL
jgi:hypothetical protein